jgi:hypothetical protein
MGKQLLAIDQKKKSAAWITAVVVIDASMSIDEH